MSETPLISVITPTLNPGRCLQTAIDSVVQQTAPCWEHLVVDGGSQDGTLNLLKSAEHMRWTVSPGAGVYGAMNRAIGLARGQWLYFLGADDSLHAADVFERVRPTLGGPYDVVYGDVISDRFGGRYGGKFDLARLYDVNICHQAIFLHRRVFESVGLFDERYSTQADWDHNIRWMTAPGIRSIWVDLVIANYADGGRSSRGADPDFMRDRRYQILCRGHGSLPRVRAIGWTLREILASVRRLDFRRLGRAVPLAMRVLGGRE